MNEYCDNKYCIANLNGKCIVDKCKGAVNCVLDDKHKFKNCEEVYERQIKLMIEREKARFTNDYILIDGEYQFMGSHGIQEPTPSELEQMYFKSDYILIKGEYHFMAEEKQGLPSPPPKIKQIKIYSKVTINGHEEYKYTKGIWISSDEYDDRIKELIGGEK